MKLLRLLVVLGVLGGLTTPASAQSLVRLFSETYADTLSSNGDSFTFDVRGMASARIQTLDTYSGTWEVQCSTDGGVTYDEDDELPMVLLGASSEVSSVTDTVGIWTVNVAGCTHIRVIATAGFAASDTKVQVTAISAGGGAGGSGGGSSFDGVLRDAAGGDPVTDTTNDAIRVNVVAGGSSGNGTSLADDADFTAGTTAFTPVGGFYQSTPTACTDGDACVAGITSARAVKVALENASGTTAFGTAGSPSTAVLSIQGVASGTAVQVQSNSANLATQTTAAAIQTATEAIQTAVELLDNAVSGSGINISQIGGAAPAAEDPCVSGTQGYFPVDVDTATTTQIAAAVSGQTLYICGVNLVAAAAQTVAIVEDDTASCASPTAGLNGGVTAAEGWSFDANGGIALGTGAAWVMKASAANRYVCIITGQAAQLSGGIRYAIQ